MMSYINETDFVIENKELVYPEIVTDGLQLYYDAKGKRDTDYHRDTMLDMSGNKNHGKLHNFAYEKHSGYKDGLVFDYIDDKLIRPELDLQPNDFTFMLNGNIISFSPDGTVKRVQDGEVIESKGFNLIENGDFSDGLTSWDTSVLSEAVVDGNEATITTTEKGKYGLWQGYDQEGLKYISAEFYSEDETASFTLGSTGVYSTIPNGAWTRVSSVNSDKGIIRFYGDSGLDKHYKIRKPIIINLTETFGAGNEPTKEQMDEIINQFGFIPNAQNLIDRIEYKGNDLGDMENIIDGLYKTDVLSGEEVYTDEADDDAVVHVEVDGKSYQHAGSGKNLFDGKVEPGYYDMSNLAERATTAHSRAVNLIKVKENTTYTMTRDTAVNGFFHFIDASLTLISAYARATKEVTFTTPPGTKYLLWHIDDPGNNTRDFSKFQLEEGSIATAYEPPAPTPDSPIKIHSLNDFDVVSSVGRENLLTFNEVELYSPTKEVIDIDKGLISGETPWYVVWRGIELKAGLYTFSSEFMSTSGTNRTVTIRDENSYSTISVPWEVNRSFSYTFEIKKDSSYYLAIYFNRGSRVPFTVVKPKLEKGDIATEWTLAPEDITESENHPMINKINILLDEPLRSVGDVKDRLFRDSDGVWKVERNVGEFAVKGSDLEAISVGEGNNVVTTRVIDNIYASNYQVPFGSSHYKRMNSPAGTWSHASNVETGTVNPKYKMWLSVNKETVDTLAKARTWINEENSKGTPVIVSYQLAVPVIDILSQSLQDKLNNLRSFSESNYVYTINGNTNLLDTVPLLVNNLYNSLGVLESNNGHTATKDAIPVYPGTKIHLTKITKGDNIWRIVWVDKNNNLIFREISEANDLVLTIPNGAYGMRVSYPNGSNPVIEFYKSDTSLTLSENIKPTLHAKFLYNDWYKEDRVINNLMIYNRALTNEEMIQNYKTIKRRWGM